MSIKNGVITGAAVGAGIALVLLSLEYIRPFSANANAFVERLTFKLCPVYILIFTNYISKEWMVIAHDPRQRCAVRGGLRHLSRTAKPPAAKDCDNPLGSLPNNPLPGFKLPTPDSSGQQ
jgi:hypothetical protein